MTKVKKVEDETSLESLDKKLKKEANCAIENVVKGEEGERNSSCTIDAINERTKEVKEKAEENEKNAKEAWIKLLQLDKAEGLLSRNIKIVDIRIPNKVFMQVDN